MRRLGAPIVPSFRPKASRSEVRERKLRSRFWKHDGSCCTRVQSFYVVQDVKTKKCTITETKPTSSEVTVVSGDSVYKTKTEAETGMKTIKVCTSN
jgi:LysM repeat protein